LPVLGALPQLRSRTLPFLGEAARASMATSLPFGGGPRLRIGEHFAPMEAQVIPALAAQRFHLRLLPGQKIWPEPVIMLRPRPGVWMTLHCR
jgi:cytochrome P450